MKLEKESIYGMELHDTFVIDTANVVQRVPGGWIYRHTDTIESGNGISLAVSMVFVPFSLEFQPTSNFSKYSEKQQ
jgi:hypothetical protein